MNQIKKIVIVGGGTSGWMTAMIFAHALKEKNLQIQVIESSDVGIIGVGEGSTPILKKFFDNLGITEQEWMPACNATYKTGIEFKAWSTHPGYESYFHPFATLLDKVTAPSFYENIRARQAGHEVIGKPDLFFLSSHLADKKLAPVANENFPFSTNYGYHFDSALLGQFLRSRAGKLGVATEQLHIEQVLCDEHGDIKRLKTREGIDVEGDFFIDCSGFSGLLITQTLATPFVSYAEHLFNDSAIALPSALKGESAPKTESIAMKYGWSWRIPLQNRYGNGYVYSSAYTSDDQAETEIRTHLDLMDEDVSVRKLKMRLGRVSKHWNKNCLAVGLSQGFLEPLEATALYLTQMTIAIFTLFFEKGDFSANAQAIYNQEINQYFDGHRDYIIAHYKTNSRTDTDYWKDNARGLNNIPASLKSVLETWISGGDLQSELIKQDIEKYYPLSSWCSLLGGMGIYPAAQQRDESLIHAQKNEMHEFMRRCCLNFPNQKIYLEQMTQK